MKIFIVYASVGSGHFKAAEAIYNCLKQNNKILEIKLIDVLKISNFLFVNIYTYGYTFLVNYALWLWLLAFYTTCAKPLCPVTGNIHSIINRLNTKRFIDLLIRENPDIIISTHFLPSNISASLKKSKKINSKIITVITDFGVHPFWISQAVDIYVVASSFTEEQLVLEGVKKESIKVTGIPIDSKFLKQYDKGILCRNLNIEQDEFTVLIVTGSFGIGPIEEIIDLLRADVQILVVCAKNKSLFLRLKNKNYPKVRIFGFVDNIEELMAVSSVIITKPGGLTISELLAMELIPIFISAIPGQETENVSALARFNIGSILENTRDIKETVLDYKANPDKLNKIKENIRKIKKPFAAQELCDVVCEGSFWDSC